MYVEPFVMFMSNGLLQGPFSGSPARCKSKHLSCHSRLTSKCHCGELCYQPSELFSWFRTSVNYSSVNGGPTQDEGLPSVIIFAHLKSFTQKQGLVSKKAIFS